MQGKQSCKLESVKKVPVWSSGVSQLAFSKKVMVRYVPTGISTRFDRLLALT